MEQAYRDALGTDPEVINKFWTDYFKQCTMGTPDTGMEMPHEEDNLNLALREFDLLSSLRG